MFLSCYTVACLETLKPSSEKTNRTRDLHPFCLVSLFFSKLVVFNDFTEVGILLRIFTYLCKDKRLCNNTFIPGCDADLDRRESGGQSLWKAPSIQSSRLFFPVVRIGSPHPLTRECCSPLPFGNKGGDTLACGGGGGRTQFRRWDRHYGTLIPLRWKGACEECCVSSRRHLFFQEKQKTHYLMTSHYKYRGFFVEAVRDQCIIF